MFLISIDIGLYHLGFLYAIAENRTYRILKCKLLNLKRMTEYCSIKDCLLNHELCFADYCKHFFHQYAHEFNEATYIVVEQQPPNGLMAIQELIRYEFRDKIRMVSPNTMHAYFKIQHLNYEQRKEFVIRYANTKLSSFKEYQTYVRKHDMADALCILVVFLFEYWNNEEKMNQKSTDEKTHEHYLTFIQSFTFQ